MAAPPDRAGVIEDSLRGGRFRFKTRPFRDRAVPFDERRDRPCSGDDAFEQAPDRVGDGPVVAVDEQRLALVVALFGMSGEMDFADEPKRIIRQIVERQKPWLVADTKTLLTSSKRRQPVRRATARMKSVSRIVDS